MQVLYAVDFDVLDMATNDPNVAYEKLMEHLHNWLSWGSSDCPTREDLQVDGSAAYHKVSIDTKPESGREASWKSIDAGDFRAFRIDIRQPLLTEGTWFQTRVTVSKGPEQSRLRVLMGREITTGWLSPAPFDILRRPRLILSVTSDNDLDVRILKQRVDDKYLLINSIPALAPLMNAVQNSTRLPLLVISVTGSDGRRFAITCARELQGLARVATLNAFLTDRFNRELERSPIPFGGARLYWPDPSLRQPLFSALDISEDTNDNTVQRVMRLLAPMSVIARGTDMGWTDASTYARKLRTDEMRARLSELQQSGDLSQQISILADELAHKQDEIDEWEQFNGALLTEIEQLKGELQLTADYRYQAEHWKGLYLDTTREHPPIVPEALLDTPQLTKGNIGDVLGFMKNVTDGSLSYTDNAVKSWEKSDYPFPDVMGSQLISLARAAIAYRRVNGKIGKRLDEWLEEEFSLRLAMSDKGLVQAKLDKFTFEGTEYSRVPHVKIDDHTSPDRVGRIYFAVDHEETRFILDHIGLKLYGL